MDNHSKNHRFSFYLLLCLPALFAIVSYQFILAKGGYYVNPDAEYKYLFSSLDVAQWRFVKFVDHPGSTLQVLGAIVIRIYYRVAGQEDSLVNDVLVNSEGYLLAINWTLLAMILILLLCGGYAIVKSSGKLFYGLIFQLSLFNSTTTLRITSDVNTELLLISLSLLLFYLCFQLSSFRKEKVNSFSTRWLLPVVIALGIATKLSFAPFAITPLFIVSSWREKISYCLRVFLFFTLFIFPTWSFIPYLYQWAGGILTHSSNYGTGEANFVDWKMFIRNALTVLISEPMFSLNYIVLVTTASWLYYSTRRGAGKKNLRLITLLSILAGIFFQLILVFKHFSPRYLVPSYILCFCSNIILIQILFLEVKFKAVLIKPVWKYALPGLLILGGVFRYRKITYNLKLQHQEFAYTQNIKRFELNHFPKGIKVYFFGIGNLPYALKYGIGHSTAPYATYSEQLSKMYPDTYFYCPYDFNLLTDQTNDLYDWENNKIEAEKIIKRPGQAVISAGWTGILDRSLSWSKQAEGVYQSGEITLFRLK